MLIDFKLQAAAGPTGMEQSPGRDNVCTVRALAAETGTWGLVNSTGLSHQAVTLAPANLPIRFSLHTVFVTNAP